MAHGLSCSGRYLMHWFPLTIDHRSLNLMDEEDRRLFLEAFESAFGHPLTEVVHPFIPLGLS